MSISGHFIGKLMLVVIPVVRNGSVHGQWMVEKFSQYLADVTCYKEELVNNILPLFMSEKELQQISSVCFNFISCSYSRCLSIYIFDVVRLLRTWQT